MCFVLLQKVMLCRFLPGTLYLLCHPILEFLWWFFCLDDLSIDDGRVLKSSITIVFHFTSVCLMKFSAPMLGPNKLMIVISSCCIIPFISVNRPPLSVLTSFGLKSTFFWYMYIYLSISIYHIHICICYVYDIWYMYSCLFWGAVDLLS
jgi:hypothetical protein